MTRTLIILGLFAVIVAVALYSSSIANDSSGFETLKARLK
jgi:hypothetical protein